MARLSLETMTMKRTKLAQEGTATAELRRMRMRKKRRMMMWRRKMKMKRRKMETMTIAVTRMPAMMVTKEVFPDATSEAAMTIVVPETPEIAGKWVPPNRAEKTEAGVIPMSEVIVATAALAGRSKGQA